MQGKGSVPRAFDFEVKEVFDDRASKVEQAASGLVIDAA
jgi:hypothetical protein